MIAVPFVDGTVDKSFAGVDPLLAAVWIEHVLFIGLFNRTNLIHGLLCCKHIPAPVGSQDQASMHRDVNIMAVCIGFGGYNEDVFLGIVAP